MWRVCGTFCQNTDESIAKNKKISEAIKSTTNTQIS